MRHDRNYDNVFYALLTLFEVSTLEQWPDIMYTTIDGVGKHRGPSRDHN